MPLIRIGQLLGASAELKTVSARTRRMRELQTLYSASAPADLAKASRVKNLREGTLVIAADNAAIAAKLRQVAPRVLAKIGQSDPTITEVRVQVQVSGRARTALPASRKSPLSAAALKKIEALSKHVESEELSSALARLVRHQRRPGRAR